MWFFKIVSGFQTNFRYFSGWRYQNRKDSWGNDYKIITNYYDYELQWRENYTKMITGEIRYKTRGTHSIDDENNKFACSSNRFGPDWFFQLVEYEKKTFLRSCYYSFGWNLVTLLLMGTRNSMVARDGVLDDSGEQLW